MTEEFQSIGRVITPTARYAAACRILIRASHPASRDNLFASAQDVAAALRSALIGVAISSECGVTLTSDFYGRSGSGDRRSDLHDLRQ